MAVKIAKHKLNVGKTEDDWFYEFEWVVGGVINGGHCAITQYDVFQYWFPVLVQQRR